MMVPDLSSVLSALISLSLVVLAGWSVMAPLIVIPVWRIFRRAGVVPWWSLAVLFPVVGLFIAALALARVLRTGDDVPPDRSARLAGRYSID